MAATTLTVQSLAALAAAWLLSTGLTPMAHRLAHATGLLDRPHGNLKAQRQPVAYLGGAAVAAAWLLVAAWLGSGAQGPSWATPWRALLWGSALMAGVGLVDDIRPLGVAAKLFAQAAVACGLLRCGICLQLAVLPHWANGSLTVLWLVGMTNAVNILDVADGLATIVGAVAALALAAWSLLGVTTVVSQGTAAAVGAGAIGAEAVDAAQVALGAPLAAALAGALLGFLPFNWKPARIYLGDTGSLFLGLSLAVLAVQATPAGATVGQASMPLCGLGVFILEVTLVCAARARAGKNPLSGSPDHMALRLQHAGIKPPAVALGAAWLGGWAATWAIVANVPGCSKPLVTAAWTLSTTPYGAALLWLWRKPPPLSPPKIMKA